MVVVFFCQYDTQSLLVALLFHSLELLPCTTIISILPTPMESISSATCSISKMHLLSATLFRPGLQTCGTSVRKKITIVCSRWQYTHFKDVLDLGSNVPGKSAHRYKTFKLYKMSTYLNNVLQFPRPGYWA